MMARMLRVRTASLLVAVAILVPSCSGSSTNPPPDAGSPAIVATNAPLLPRTAPGLPSFDSQKLEALLAQLKGTPVVLNIWASWCGPCRDEAPLLTAAAKRYGHQVQFLGVDILDQTGSAAKFATEFHVPYPSVFDPTGGIRDGLGLLGQPDTIFFDAQGTKVKVVSGALTAAVLEAQIRALLGNASPT
jgi:cytochrome c biogenesis protein CcmG/thiol:disulfide interchange protein DsbE